MVVNCRKARREDLDRLLLVLWFCVCEPHSHGVILGRKEGKEKKTLCASPDEKKRKTDLTLFWWIEPRRKKDFCIIN